MSNYEKELRQIGRDTLRLTPTESEELSKTGYAKIDRYGYGFFGRWNVSKIIIHLIRGIPCGVDPMTGEVLGVVDLI